MTTKPIIEVKDLKKSFGTLQVLKGINTEVQKGEVVVVIGPSGSGKSTFLRCLNLLETPTAGSIYVDGAEITDPKCDINLHRQKMGMVFQHFNLFNNMTILRNSPADRSSGSPLCGRCAWTPRSCSLMSRPARWTPKWWARCWML